MEHSYLNPHPSPNPHLRLHTSIFLHIQPCLHTTLIFCTHTGPISEPTKSIHHLPHRSPSSNLSYLNPHGSPNSHLRLHTSIFFHIQRCLHTTVVYGTHNSPTSEPTKSIHQLPHRRPSFNFSYLSSDPTFSAPTTPFLFSTYRFSSQVAPLNIPFFFPICTSRHGPGENRSWYIPLQNPPPVHPPLQLIP